MNFDTEGFSKEMDQEMEMLENNHRFIVRFAVVMFSIAGIMLLVSWRLDLAWLGYVAAGWIILTFFLTVVLSNITDTTSLI